MIKEYLVITEDAEEKKAIAKRLMEDVTSNFGGKLSKFYTPLMLAKLQEDILHYEPNLGPSGREDRLCRFVYDYWVYGCAVDEEYYLHLKDMTDSEKREYMVRQIRNVYVNHLNRDAGPDRVQKLADKYRLYRLLQPYYRREVIEVGSMDDLPVFEAFARKLGEFVVKPSDFSFGIGVHKFSMDGFGGDYAAALACILGEGRQLNAKNPSKNAKMVLEELIRQDESLSALHADSVNGIRATAVRGKDGKIHIYHPWIKVGVGGAFVASAAFDGFDAEIDPQTGIVISDGYQESGKVYKVHPNSGITIKGLKIPKWNELVHLVDEIMAALPGYGYIGWDLVLTPEGWCVMEGNYSGEFIYQMINQRGYKKEFEELIGWKYEKDFWWETHGMFMHN